MAEIDNSPKLSRAERRRIEKKKGKKATYCYSQEQINDMIKKAVLEQKKDLVAEITNVVLEQYIVITMGVLYDRFNFDREQLLNFKSSLEDFSDLMESNSRFVDDYKMVFKDKFGIVFHNSPCEGVEHFETANSKIEEYKESVVEDSKFFMLVVVLYVLRQEFGFASKRGTRLIEGVIKYMKLFKSTDSSAFDTALRSMCGYTVFGNVLSMYDPKIIDRLFSDEGGVDNAEK